VATRPTPTSTLEEAVSWGKIADAGKHVTCYCDVTIALPLLCNALAERVCTPRTGPQLDWLFEGLL
jgi:deoxyhypusine synthase